MLDNIVFELTLIMVGAAAIATVFLFGKQPIILAYIVVGMLAGPSGFGWIANADRIDSIAHIGVILLLFLLGMHLQPERLIQVFRKTFLTTLVTCLAFGSLSGVVAIGLGFSRSEALIVGAALMFSSTVIGLKLIPTTTLHQRHTGEMMTSVLLLQDIVAIMVLLLLTATVTTHWTVSFAILGLKLVGLGLMAFGGVRYVLVPLFKRFDVIQEYTFLITLAWCFFTAELAHLWGLSYEMGAFVGGLSLATCHIALIIAEELKSLREFFLILFFFSIGARFDVRMDIHIWLGGLLLGFLLVVVKPLFFFMGFRLAREGKEIARELAVRLGQASEFSLLVAFAAQRVDKLSISGAYLIQLATMVTFVVSTYWVVLKYPTPISSGPRLRQN